MKRFFVPVMLFAILLSACAPVASTPVIPTGLPAVSNTPATGGGVSQAVFEAQKALSAQLDIPIEQIQVSSTELVDWPDSCLGLPAADEMCAEVITPGYRIILRVNLLQYEFHSTADGSSLRLASGVAPGDSGEESRPMLAWESPDCAQFSVTLDAAFYGFCGESLVLSSAVTPTSVEKAMQWGQKYAAFEAETPAGRVSFNGNGPNVATPAEQRMMAEWAQLTFSIAQSGRTGAAWGLAFAYNRSGGIAGFCDDVGVYLAGYAQLSTCNGLNATIPLTATQLQQVYRWYDTYRQIDYQHSDAAVADAMSITLVMPGQGNILADEEVGRVMTEFSADLLAQGSFERAADQTALKAAEGTIFDFLTALSDGNYTLAAKIYAGDTSLLAGWNPDIVGNLPAWLERGCVQNGLNCLFPRSITYRGPDAEGSLQFFVEYDYPDGRIFQQGPCCGDESGVVSSSFLVRAAQQGDLWLVLDLPPYMP